VPVTDVPGGKIVMQTVARNQHKPGQKDFPYFRRLWRSIITALFLAAFLPLISIGGGMYYYAASAVKNQTLKSLSREVRQHQKTIDRFLSERVLDLRAISHSIDLEGVINPGTLAGIFRALQPTAEDHYYTDLGIIDQRGVHRAYVGPYDLIHRIYKDEHWFKTVMASDVYISDLFAGFRKVPHFIIAVKKTEDDQSWIIRATIKADYFNKLIASTVVKEKGDALLVNQGGIFQCNPRNRERTMRPSGIRVPTHFDGIRIEESSDRIQVMVWLKSVPWLSVVQMDRKSLFEPLWRLRNVGFFVLVLGAILISLTVLLTTNYLVERLERKRSRIKRMDQHLRQANKMTLSLQLYKGFFQEMNEYLSNIASAAEWIGERNRDTLDPEKARKDIHDNLEQIQAEILWSKKTIHELMHFSLPVDAIVQPVNINDMLNDMVELFLRELYFNNIRIRMDYEDPLPTIRCDLSLMRQVFQNLLFNAFESIGKNGEICLTTRSLGDRIRITIADSGPGIPPGVDEDIFEPLFSTHPKKLGLGLSICRDILEKVGGSIHLETNVEKGVAFMVEVPLRFKQSSPP
jgi:two-component system, NtrC family, sensor kinase